MFVALSLVTETIVAIIAEVASKLAPTASADDAVLLIATANSSVSDAVFAANALQTSVTWEASVISNLKPRIINVPHNSLNYARITYGLLFLIRSDYIFTIW